MVAIFAYMAIGLSFMHIFCVMRLQSRTYLTPLFSEFRKNVRRGGYALRSEFLMPRAKQPELLLAAPEHQALYRLVRLTAHGALASAIASILLELWLLLRVGE